MVSCPLYQALWEDQIVGEVMRAGYVPAAARRARLVQHRGCADRELGVMGTQHGHQSPQL